MVQQMSVLNLYATYIVSYLTYNNNFPFMLGQDKLFTFSLLKMFVESVIQTDFIRYVNGTCFKEVLFNIS